MYDLFVGILNISLISCYTIVVVMVVRALILRWERKYAYLLWFVVFLNLCIPFRITGPFSLVPAWIAEFDLAKEDENVLENVSESKTDYLPNEVIMHHYYTPAEEEVDLKSETADRPGTDTNSETVYVPGTDTNSDTLYVSEPLDSASDYLPNESITIMEMPSVSAHHYETPVQEDGVPGTNVNDETTYLSSEDKTRELLGGILALVWGIGVVLLTAGNIRAVLKLRGRLKNAEPYWNKDTLMQEASGTIKVADGIQTPFLWGLFSPVIYLPRGIDAEEQTYIIRHESYHRKRKDYIFKPLFFMIVVIHWLNPLVWAAYFLFVRDMEISCDEAVIASADEDIRKKYAASLLKYAARQNGYTLTPITFGEPSLRCRIEKVLYYHETNAYFSACILCVVIVVMAGLTFRPKLTEISDYQRTAQPVTRPETQLSEDVVYGRIEYWTENNTDGSVLKYRKRIFGGRGVGEGTDKEKGYNGHYKLNKWGTGTLD